MRVLLVGGAGTIGRRLAPALAGEHDIIVAGRNSGDVRVDITSADSIRSMFEQTPDIDAVVGIAASGPLDVFDTLTEEQLLANMRGKFFGQANVVLIGQHYVNVGGSFTLTSGVFADQAAKGVTSGGVVSGALHSFVLSAAMELQGRYRVNAVSPTMVEDSADEFGHLFPGLRAVPMTVLVDHYVGCVEGTGTGQIIRAYG
ncbi:short chain dehydrogenase [Mycobacterium sp. URHB0044]|uniref:short chain dehydrogenase n=1 Tax=Mycobacterium sp. URHB0044 TaxID=1380386 RepID=UPI00048B931F|nr:short chain dehydrogenase [Mycobacterium sp. URHB0044]